jgi:hypothetical protein
MRNLIFFVTLMLCYQSFSAQFNYKVDCQNAADCPEWFATLIYEHGVCSSSLIGSDIIATNLHCLPDDLARAGAFCNGRIEFIFPASATKEEERAECDRVLYLSPPLGKEIIKPDYAFIKLKQSPHRHALEISQKGFPDASHVTIYKLDPDTGGQRGVVKKTDCTAIQNSILNPYFTTDTAPLVLLAKCDIIKGNSGSPLILDDGAAHGVVSATMEVPMSPALRERIGSKPKLNFGFGSNFSCLTNPDLGFFMEKASDCEIEIDPANQLKRAEAMTQKMIDTALAELQEKVNNGAQKDLLAGKPLLLWRAIDEKPTAQKQSQYNLLKVTFIPQCLLPKTTDLTPYEAKLSTKQISMPQEIPEYTISETLDDFLRYKVKREETKRKIPFKLTPKDLIKKRNISVLFNEKPMQLNLCSEYTLPKK